MRGGREPAGRRGRLLLAGAFAVLAVAAVAAWQIKSIDVPYLGESSNPPIVLGESDGCTLIGCSPPGVSVASKDVRDAYPSAVRLRACADGHCATAKLQDSNLQMVRVPLPYEEPQPVSITLSVLGEESRVLDRAGFEGELQSSYPNGRDCPGHCINLTVLYDATEGELATKPERLEEQGLVAAK